MSFQAVYGNWLEKHLKERNGEEKRKLADGHGHVEKLFLERVWYPAMKQLEYLHREYKVADFRDGSRFCTTRICSYKIIPIQSRSIMV